LKSKWAYSRAKRHFCSRECWDKVERSCEHRRKIATKRVEWFKDEDNRTKISGENHPNWLGGSSLQYRKRNGTRDARLWIKQALRRDSFRCLLCGDGDNLLHVHHIIPWSIDPDNNFHPDNGITLCQECHTIIHINKSQFNPLPARV